MLGAPGAPLLAGPIVLGVDPREYLLLNKEVKSPSPPEALEESLQFLGLLWVHEGHARAARVGEKCIICQKGKGNYSISCGARYVSVHKDCLGRQVGSNEEIVM